MLRPFSPRFAAVLCAASLAVFVCQTSRPAFAAGDDWEAKNALVQGLRQSAARLQKSGDFAGAIAACRQAIHADPLDPDTYADLGDAYMASGQTADALRWYREATGTLPGQKWMSSRMEEGDLCLRFASVLAQMNRWDEAVMMYRKGRETLPNGSQKLLASKWQVKKLTTDPAEQKAFLTTTRLALGAWYSCPDLALNESAAGDKAASAFRAAVALSPNDSTVSLFMKNGLIPRTSASVLAKAQ